MSTGKFDPNEPYFSDEEVNQPLNLDPNRIIIRAKCAADLRKPERKFIVRPWFVRGYINMVTSDPGLGKSLMLARLTASATQTRYVEPPIWPRPNGYAPAPAINMRVVHVSSDDDPEDIGERCVAAGANIDNVFVIDQTLQNGQDIIPTFDNLPAYEDFFALYFPKQAGNPPRPTPGILIFDTMTMFFPKGTSANDGADVYRVLRPLAQLAKKYDVTLICVRHNSKNNSGSAAQKGAGSMSLNGIIRSEVILMPHPEERDMFVIAHNKYSFTKRGETLKYNIKPGKNPDDAPTLAFQGTDDRSANEILKALQSVDKKSTKKDLAKNFILNIVKDYDLPTKFLEVAMAASEVSVRTLNEARAEIRDIVVPKKIILDDKTFTVLRHIDNLDKPLTVWQPNIED